jgi:TANFOR domain-containing protein
MKMRPPIFCLAAALMLLAAPAVAQVTVTVLVPRPSPYLSDYQSQPGRILITLRSTPSSPVLQVRLTGFIEGLDNGIRIATRESFRPSRPITLMPGVLYELNSSDLSTLFNADAFTVTGTTVEEIFRGGGLPEGSYRLCVRVFEFSGNRPLSAQAPAGCSTPFIIRTLEPPQLTHPPNGESVPAILQIFRWLPPASAPATTQYALKIVEVTPPLSADDAINSGRVHFERPMLATTLYAYGPADPPFEVGRTYAWRVTASDPGRSVTFRNNGRSEVFQFTYGSPAGLSLSASPGELNFEPAVTTREITIRLRGAGGVIMDAISFLLLDGGRIVHGPTVVTSEVAGTPVTSDTRITLNYAISQTLQSELLGSRERAELTLQIRGRGHRGDQQVESEYDDELDAVIVVISRGPASSALAVAVSSATGLPLAYNPASQERFLDFNLSTSGRRNIQITRWVTEWRFPNRAPDVQEEELPAGGITVRPGAAARAERRVGMNAAQQNLLLSELARGGNEARFRLVFIFEGRDESGGTYRAAAQPEVEVVVSRSGAQGFALESAYPAAGDTIPWNPNMLVVAFNPYDDALRGVTYDLTLTDETAGRNYTNQRRLNWPEVERR